MSDKQNKYQVIKEFRRRKQRQWIALIPTLAAVVLLIVYKPVTVLVGFSLVVMVLAFSLLNWRCPACNKYLGRELNRKECPRCGADFQ